MSRIAGIAAVVAALIASNCSARAGSESRLQLRDTIRILEGLQDATAKGEQAAVDVQSKLTLQIDTDIKNIDWADLQDPRNLRALAVYLFSGGNPDVVEQRLAPLKNDQELKGLLDGALAYTRGDKINAGKLLKDVDPDKLPANLGGRVALVKAILISQTDLKSALKLLSTVRTLMPGTLVEEAALRRCINFAGKLRDVRQLELCASLYVRRFPKSVYWQEFEDNFALTQATVDYANEPRLFARMDMGLSDLPLATHRKMLLAIGKAAVTRGKFSLANLAAARSNQMSLAGSVDMVRSNLYMGAGMIVLQDYEAGRRKLEAINRAVLDESDQALLDKALNIVNQIAEQPAISREKAVETLSPSEQKANLSQTYIDVVARAQNALADASDNNMGTLQ